jgi:3-oxoacyl-[acyl-carrier-protein] synthase-1
MRPILVSAFTMTSCLGRGIDPTRAALRAARSGLAPCRFETVELDTFLGEIAGVDGGRLPAPLAAFDCRNNRAAELGLAQDAFLDAIAHAAERHGRARVGVFMGTSTAGILQTELAYRRRNPDDGSLPPDFDYRRTHNTFSIAEFTRARLGLEGPCAAISTACSSSAKAFASAARLIECGVIDAAVVGGVDTLCLTTLYGFDSLELLSKDPCRPYDAGRDGISIGEAAAFALLEKARPSGRDGTMWLLGAGESCDAFHMSAPHPEGLGARRAMQAALDSAGLQPDDIGYVNLHGTATRNNDASEDKAVVGLLGSDVPCSSTKGMTGHALGAAGAVEAIFAMLAVEEDLIPGSPGTRILDPALKANYRIRPEVRRVPRAMTNSFGFGGSNCCLVFGRPA